MHGFKICTTDASKFRSAFGPIFHVGIYSEKIMCAVHKSVLAEMSSFVSAFCILLYEILLLLCKLRNDRWCHSIIIPLYPRVYRKQPLYLTKVAVCFVYILPSLDPTCEIELHWVFCCCTHNQPKFVWSSIYLHSLLINVIKACYLVKWFLLLHHSSGFKNTYSYSMLLRVVMFLVTC